MPIQNLPKLQNLKNDRYSKGEDVMANDFDPVPGDRATGRSGNFMQDVPLGFMGKNWAQL